MAEVHKTRLHKLGNSTALLIPKPALDQLTWRKDDMIIIRADGKRLICERVPIESLAKLQLAEVSQ